MIVRKNAATKVSLSCFLMFAACAEDESASDDEGSGSVVSVRSPATSSDTAPVVTGSGLTAQIEGTLRVDGGCPRIGDVPVLIPDQQSRRDGPRTPAGEVIPHGALVTGGGGYFRASDLGRRAQLSAEQIDRRCIGSPDQEVFVADGHLQLVEAGS